MTAQSTNRTSGGFSLLELLLAVTILLLVAMVAFPLLGYSLKRWRSRQFARRVLSAHRAARMHALQQQRRVQVRYDIDRERVRFWVCGHPDEKGACDPEDWVPTDAIPLTRADPKNVDIWSVGHRTSGQACLVFTPSGYVYPPRGATAGNRGCGGPDVGSGVHITWKPPPTGESTSPCDWQTVYTLGIGNGRSFLLSYGAYPSEPNPASGRGTEDAGGFVSFHRWSMGTPPECAYRRWEGSGDR